MNLSENVLIGAVYIPPESSKYSSPDIFAQIENDLLSFTNTHKYICMIGDFNSRTSSLNDFVEIIDDNFEDGIFSNDITLLDEMHVPRCRSSKDTVVNNYGRYLLELCKYSNLFILNGRCGADRNIGDFTCKNVSVIDYCISNVDFISILSDLHIMPFTSILSDVHNAMIVELKNEKVVDDYVYNNVNNVPNIEVACKWNDDQKDDYHKAVSDRQHHIDTIVDSLINQNPDNVNIDFIDEITDEICTVYTSSAKEAFGVRILDNPAHKTKRFKKPWFTKYCSNARQNYRKAKRIYKRFGGEVFKHDFYVKERRYKQTLKKSVITHKSAMKSKLNTLRSKNPKEYWKIINGKPRKRRNDVPLNELYEFFRELNDNADEPVDPDYVLSMDEMSILSNIDVNIDINEPISVDEILACVKSLKRNKSCGDDNIFNEYITNSIDIMLPVYVALFNTIFDSGIVPSTWLIGNIVPIYKNKGDTVDPNNYRPITLISCIGKLFTSVINDRLTKYSDKAETLLQNQAGFRRKHSTIDHVFSLYSLIELFKNRSKKLYCAFIDFEKAFDSVWRLALWNKILKYSVNGKCFNVIVNMYDGIKARIKANNMFSDCFPCKRGVRQGENLSPFLFSLFLNDIEQFLSSHGVSGLESISRKYENEFDMYLKIFILLYADDTVLLSESKDDLQHQLNIFHAYCSKWHMKVNEEKTKIMIFGRGKQPAGLKFVYNGTELEIVNHFKYLGVLFSKTGSFTAHVKSLYEKARKAMYGVISKCRNHNLSIDCQLDLFDKVVKPVLLYGCEVWGFSNINIVEKLQLKFCKYILNLNNSTPNYMVYGELGRYPLSINIKVRMVTFWANMIYSNKLCTKLYALLQNIDSPWMKCIKNIFDECGLSYVWLNHSFYNVHWLKTTVYNILYDQFVQKWHSDIFNSPKALNYRIFKRSHALEKYLLTLPIKKAKLLCKFRTCNLKLPIEIGRWNNTRREERKCNLCNTNDLGDEFHYMFSCDQIDIKTMRKKCLPVYYYRNPNTVKFERLFNCTDQNTLNMLCKFIHVIKERVQPPG